MHYSFFSLFRNAMSGHRGWTPTWRDAAPKSAYDAVIVGGGGHGLATAYYLAKEHGLTNVAVLEKGWLGGGNIGRNTTIIRSNYLLAGQYPLLRIVDEALGRAGAGLELQRHGQPARRVEPLSFRWAARRLCAARQCHALARRRCRAARSRAGPRHAAVPRISTTRAFRSRAASCKSAAARRGTMRSPGAMRAAPSDRGVDIVQNCEVTGFAIENGRGDRRRDHARPDPRQKGRLRRRRQQSSRVAAHGRPAPADRKPCRCRLSFRKAIKPLIPNVITFGAGPFLHQPVRQGRSRLRRRSRRLQVLCPARQSADRARMSARAAWR